jgi:hypothetical protein
VPQIMRVPQVSLLRPGISKSQLRGFSSYNGTGEAS